MTPGEVPGELVAAAQAADCDGKSGDRWTSWTRVPDSQVRRLIAGAVTAEREHIAELATQHHARTSCEDCTKMGAACGLGPEFVDLIRQEPQP